MDKATLGGPAGPRKLAGWLDLDKYPIKDVAAVAGVLVDVRSPKEYARGHIEGALNIPLDELDDRADELPKDRPVFLYCAKGMRSTRAAHLLTARGFEASSLGGWTGYAQGYVGRLG